MSFTSRIPTQAFRRHLAVLATAGITYSILQDRRVYLEAFKHRFHFLDLNSRRYSAIPDLDNQTFHSVVLTESTATALSNDGQIYEIDDAGKLVRVKGVEKGAIGLAANERWVCVGLGDRIKLYSSAEANPEIVTVQMPYGERLKQVSAGRESVIVLAESGTCYDLQPNNTLTRIKSLPPVAEIATGESHILFRTKDGTVYGLGSNSFGQLGAKFEERFFNEPTLIKIPGGNVTNVAAGGDTSFFVSRGCDVYSCGMGQYGQLGNGTWTHLQTSPTQVKTLSNIQQYNEDTQKVEYKNVDYITSGTHHAALTFTTESRYEKFGQSLYVWGKSILGMGKRSHLATPQVPMPLAGEEDGLDRMQLRNEKGARQRIVCGGDKAVVYWEAKGK